MRPITFICALAATLQLLSGDALARGWTWPVRGPVITSYRNGADPYAGGQHRGVDIGALVGTRVVAARAGMVTFAGVVGSSGLVVSERTADGRFDLSYLHLSSLTVRRGDRLAEGAAVGAVGTSGQRSAPAPHLHFGVREAGQRDAYRDPLDFLTPPAAADRPEPAPAPVGAGQPALADPSPAPAPTSPDHLPGPLPGPGSPAHSPALAPLHAPGLPSPLPSQPHGMPRLYAAHGFLPHLLWPNSADDAEPHTGLTHTSSGAPGRRADASPPASGPHGAYAATPQRTLATRSPGRPHHGINLGWLAACIGLIALATALGHPDSTRKAAARSRTVAGRRRAALARAGTRLGALLRPASRGGPAR